MTDGPLLPPPPPDPNRPAGPTLPPPPPWLSRPRPGTTPGAAPAWQSGPTSGRPAPRPDPEPRPSSPLRNLVAALAIVLVVVLGTGGLLWTMSRVGDTGFVEPTTRPTPKVLVTPRPKPSTRPSPTPTRHPLPTPAPTVVVIGVTLPITGAYAEAATAARDGAELAIEATLDTYPMDDLQIETRVLDHGTADDFDADKAEADMKALVADDAVVGVVGPYNSYAAALQIPVGNAAGLLQCSMGATSPALTKGKTAAELRTAKPDQNTFLRVITPTDGEGTAMARYAYDTLTLRRLAIFGDGEFPVALAAFKTEWVRLGGSVVVNGSVVEGKVKAADLKAVAQRKADGVFFGGATSTGGAAFAKALDKAGLGRLPLLGVSGVVDGSSDVEGSFLAATVARPGPVVAAIGGIEDFAQRSEFRSRFKARYGTEPGYYAAGAYACTQVILDGIRIARDKGPVTREAVLAAATDPARVVQTIYGATRFTPAGDLTPGSVAIYRRVPATGSDPAWWETVDELRLDP